MNLLLKAISQLLRLHMHCQSMQPNCGIFFQISFSNLSGGLLHTKAVERCVISKLVSRVCKLCSKFDFNVVIGKDRKCEENKSFVS